MTSLTALCHVPSRYLSQADYYSTLHGAGVNIFLLLLPLG